MSTATIQQLSPDTAMSPELTVIEGGQNMIDTHAGLASLENRIRETYKFRQDFLRAEQAITQRRKSTWRRLGISSAPQSTPEDKVRMKQAEWLLKFLVWQENGSKKAPPKRTWSVDGAGDHLPSVTLVESVSRPAHDGGDRGGQGATQAVVSPVVPSDPAFATSALMLGVEEVVSFAVAATWALFESERHLRKTRMDLYEKPMQKLAKELPVWPWAEACRGFAPLSLAQLVGEIGNLSDYDNPAKVWKRMGLGRVDGENQRRTTDKELAIKMGYNPARRSVMYVIGDNLIRAKNPEYYGLFLERREYERERAPDDKPIAHMRRAHRYMEKRFLRDFWRAWRSAN